jgi:hypothetical protein
MSTFNASNTSACTPRCCAPIYLSISRLIHWGSVPQARTQRRSSFFACFVRKGRVYWEALMVSGAAKRWLEKGTSLRGAGWKQRKHKAKSAGRRSSSVSHFFRLNGVPFRE